MGITPKSPTCLSFCSGYGGIELGIERVLGPLNVLAHLEIEGFAIANLVNKMETGQMVPAPIWTDLKTFRPRIFRGCVDIFTGGYPCQPFSTAGKRGGGQDPRHLWPWIRSAIKVIQPKICFFENVEGHISLGLREVLTDLVKLGYRVENDCGEPTWGLFSAVEVGAPHQRKRVFILAYRDDQWESQSGGCFEEFRKWPINGGKELGHTQGNDKRRLPVSSMHRERVEAGRSGCYELADMPSEILERCSGLERQDQRRDTPERIRHDAAGCGCFSQRWPARPGEHQHEWEEPRVLADSPCELQHRARRSRSPWRGESSNKSGGSLDDTVCGRHRGAEGKIPARRDGSIKTGGRQTKSGLGGTVTGASGRVDPTINRVDRLRLCGNGVVPQTAERAFRVLWGRIVNPDPGYARPYIQLEMF